MIEVYKTNRKFEYGFTLIELLVGMLVMGILMTVLMGTMLSMTGGITSEAVKAVGSSVENWTVKNPAQSLPTTSGYVPYSELKNTLQQQGIEPKSDKGNISDRYLVSISSTDGYNYKVCGMFPDSSKDSKDGRNIYISASGESRDAKDGECG